MRTRDEASPWARGASRVQVRALDDDDDADADAVRGATGDDGVDGDDGDVRPVRTGGGHERATPPSRPGPPSRPASAAVERFRAWIGWFGAARLAGSALAVVIVVGGGWLLVRAGPPPTESTLPFATTAPAPTTAAVAPVAGPPGATGAPGGAPAPGAAGGAGAAGETAAPAATTSGAVVVHVAGAVARPGVYELDAGSRVADAVDAAGGPVADADAGALNLAAPLADGVRVLVPLVGEEVAPGGLVVGAPPPGAGDGTGDEGGASPTGPPGPVDVNRAGAAELESLPGVGPATAAAIVAERDAGGPFATVADLERVRGIGPAKLAALEGLVTT